MSKLNKNRAELNPFDGIWFVLCAEIIAEGLTYKMGDRYPEFCNLGVLHTHFNNGVVGTKAELEGLNGVPVPLWAEDPLMPIAMFIAKPDAVVEQEIVPEKKDELDPFHMDNARLLTSKKSLVGYAAEYGIPLPNQRSINLATMLETLEAEAKELGLLPK